MAHLLGVPGREAASTHDACVPGAMARTVSDGTVGRRTHEVGSWGRGRTSTAVRESVNTVSPNFCLQPPEKSEFLIKFNEINAVFSSDA